jgi:hypothetical protein
MGFQEIFKISRSYSVQECASSQLETGKGDALQERKGKNYEVFNGYSQRDVDTAYT